ncbi:DNA gyrase subunit A [Mesorhizobium sp. M2D.F.Ca.ET.185.01.1.1]|uniref:DNA gyrase subunit A n=2 Tax=Mesorhizobium TaxID=68287 RepID=UPI000FCADC3A|nr:MULTISPECIES: DNA gyrase subunit A [unclassified Mesorhizobium]TGP80871.1 DNA gyrase subunit A [bacterium M00.F.Ca.ET.227.01.1.1]TGP90654.1 DNA gyrase subunit A [bacterium M00.F.Ca.ET.221.01.1.1]TGP97333.1 DNA gyrase subunit A [bacterium M00.F.Ca.ET.222.01.1.1]TGU07821.1 DNA gyrase subunit A [bacterium M00.F.Ca.ET.163.01.1.1]TGU26204.1 DNA gyrase subunit A [bacterium M00.F.Ca.ET.156.01.1.1]TGU47027.1 DNA gyrase subunit A [bacterium M00.F.Ca.ET.146.01.1.1]TGV70066.1 DNA gyrase subunit A [M
MTDQKTPRGPDGGPTGIEPISIIEEMQRSYLDYAMSVIVSRALPDVRDGLKPVHRRILYASHESGYHWNRKYVKSARPVADVMGKYHPHGDASIYDALVRMAQDWSLRVPLIDGQGNFGSIDGDPPAAMRYTESRLTKVAHELLEDIDKETVDFQDTYDASGSEPKVLPARFPNLLVNGSGGIAVGMATNIPPHNLSEVCNGAIAIIDNPAIDLTALMEIVPGPDFPTGGIVLGRSGIYNAYSTGRGSIVMRGRVNIEQRGNDRESIVVTEIPYQVNKASMIEKMAELVRDKRIEGISDIRDESDRQGYRVVIELKREAVADVVLNQLYRFTPLQTSFGANMVALNGGKPEVLTLIDMLKAFVSFREEVVSRRTKYLLRKARERAHVLVGLAIAVANIDEVIKLIRTAPDPQTAREQLMERRWPSHDVAPLIKLIDDPRHRINEDGTYNLSEEQARAILDLRLQRLTALGRDEIADELNKIGAEIVDFLDILSSRARIQQIVKDELVAVRDEFGTPRRTELTDGGSDMEDEDLIQREDMVVTVSHSGYIKRVPLSLYRAQRRGGKGRSGMSTKEEDFVTRLFVANTHTPVLFFSSRGIVYKEKVWRLPIGNPQSRGKALINMLPLEQGERITTIMPLPEDESSWGELDVMFATTRGTVRRNKLSDFIQVNRNGKIAMKLEEEGDEILGVETCTDNDDVLLTANSGQCIRFPVSDVRVFQSRNSVGVRGITMAETDRIISMSIIENVDASPAERAAYLKRAAAERRLAAGAAGDEEEIALTNEEVGEEAELSEERYEFLKAHERLVLTVTEYGYGKRSSSYDFRLTGRGGKGIRATDVSKTAEIGRLVATFPVGNDDQIMLVSDGGTVIRVPVNGIRFASRATKGVTIFNTAEGEKVVSVERISEPQSDEEAEEAPSDEAGSGDTGESV